jgi:hypothetical protein
MKQLAELCSDGKAAAHASFSPLLLGSIACDRRAGGEGAVSRDWYQRRATAPSPCPSPSGRGDANLDVRAFEKESDPGGKVRLGKKAAFQNPEKAPFAAGPRKGIGNFRDRREAKGAFLPFSRRERPASGASRVRASKISGPHPPLRGDLSLRERWKKVGKKAPFSVRQIRVSRLEPATKAENSQSALREMAPFLPTEPASPAGPLSRRQDRRGR